MNPRDTDPNLGDKSRGLWPPSRPLAIGGVAAAVVVAVLAIRLLAFQLYRVPSEAMNPTYAINDRILVNKLDTDPALGDIVVYSANGGRPFVHRVLGLPGQQIEIADGTVIVDGRPAVEPYLDPADVVDDFGPVIIPEDRMFVLGDNRPQALDSRTFGPVPLDAVIGTVSARVALP